MRSYHILLMRQSCSTLGSSASEHLATIFSFHSLAEAMLLLSLKLLGLISSKHPDTLLSSETLQEYSIAYVRRPCQQQNRNFCGIPGKNPDFSRPASPAGAPALPTFPRPAAKTGPQRGWPGPAALYYYIYRAGNSVENLEKPPCLCYDL